MSKKNDLSLLFKMKNRISAAKDNLAREKGRLDQTMEALLYSHKCKTTEEGEKLLTKLKASRAKKERQLNKAVAKLKEEMDV